MRRRVTRRARRRLLRSLPTHRAALLNAAEGLAGIRADRQARAEAMGQLRPATGIAEQVLRPQNA